ncbi:MAG: hypothetical protein PVG41_09325 [Desulfobacteraceae bacterium]|jgi:hypothetical protein
MGPETPAELVIELVEEMGLAMAEKGRQLGPSALFVAQILRHRYYIQFVNVPHLM